MQIKIHHKIYNAGLFIVLLLLLQSCYPPRYLSKDQEILHKNTLKYSQQVKTNLDDIESYIYLKPNRRVLGFIKFHLGVYSFFEMGSFNAKCKENVNSWNERKIFNSKKKERHEKGILKDRLKWIWKNPKDWGSQLICISRLWFMNTIGEAPVLVNEKKIARTQKGIEYYLHNKGYLLAKVDTEYHHLARKREEVVYKISIGPAYFIGNIAYSADDDLMDELINMNRSEAKIKKGQLFDIDKLNAERLRLTRIFQDHGYYKFTKDYIVFKADSGFKDKQHYINLRLEVMKIKNKTNVGGYFKVQNIKHSRYNIRNIYINPDYDLRSSLKENVKMDTLNYNGIYYVFQREENEVLDSAYLMNSLPLKADKLASQIFIGDNPEHIYKISNVEQTLQHLNSLKIFRLNSIDFKEIDTSYNETNKNLDAYILLKPTTKQAYTLELEGSNFSSNFGMAGNFIYEHRNLFRTATRFALKLKGAREKSLDLLGEQGTNFNTQEYQTEFRFTLPQLSPEFLLNRKGNNFDRFFNPKTTLSFSYLFRQRPDYTLENISFLYGYFWKSKFFTHYLNPLEISRVTLSNISDNFVLFLKNNPQLQSSYEDHFITETSYSFVYSPVVKSKTRNFSYIRAAIESAGNSLSIANLLLNKKVETGSYKIFNKEYSEFVKFDLDYRYFIPLSTRSKLAFRSFTGVGYAFLNSISMPFGKLYYSGGANSLRAWQIRTLGPGSYSDTLSLIPNQTGDLKLEINAEYRYKIFWLLETAVFLDVGNIWNLRYSENVPGGQFQWNNFSRQLAVGTGMGFRFDLSLFIFRTDVGIKLFDPALKGKNTWIYGYRPFNYKEDVNISLSIGYPF